MRLPTPAFVLTSVTAQPLQLAPLGRRQTLPTRRFTSCRPAHPAILMSTTKSEPQPSDSSPSADIQPDKATFDPLVQYVVVRRDLCDDWPRGSMVAQAVHAAVGAIWKTRDNPTTVSYCSQSGNTNPDAGVVNQQMHTVVLEVKNEGGLVKLADKLTENDIHHILWREQPENIVTALATGVYQQSTIKKFFKKLRLLK